jgi:hypothetical protein
MRQLTSLDAQFLALESSNQTGHVAGLTILDPSTTPSGELTFKDICALMEERMPLLPPLRWRLVEVPFGLDYPYWLDDPDSTSTSTSGSWRCHPGPRGRSSRSRWRGSQRVRSIAPGRSGSCI